MSLKAKLKDFISRHPKLVKVVSVICDVLLFVCALGLGCVFAFSCSISRSADAVEGDTLPPLPFASVSSFASMGYSSLSDSPIFLAAPLVLSPDDGVQTSSMPIIYRQFSESEISASALPRSTDDVLDAPLANFPVLLQTASTWSTVAGRFTCSSSMAFSSSWACSSGPYRGDLPSEFSDCKVYLFTREEPSSWTDQSSYLSLSNSSLNYAFDGWTFSDFYLRASYANLSGIPAFVLYRLQLGNTGAYCIGFQNYIREVDPSFGFRATLSYPAVSLLFGGSFIMGDQPTIDLNNITLFGVPYSVASEQVSWLASLLFVDPQPLLYWSVVNTGGSEAPLPLSSSVSQASYWDGASTASFPILGIDRSFDTPVAVIPNFFSAAPRLTVDLARSSSLIYRVPLTFVVTLLKQTAVPLVASPTAYTFFVNGVGQSAFPPVTPSTAPSELLSTYNGFFNLEVGGFTILTLLTVILGALVVRVLLRFFGGG